MYLDGRKLKRNLLYSIRFYFAMVHTIYVKESLETLIKTFLSGSPSKDKQSRNLKIFEMNNKENIAIQTLYTIKHTNQREFKFKEINILLLKINELNIQIKKLEKEQVI